MFPKYTSTVNCPNEKFTFSVLGFLSLGQPPYSCDSFVQDFLNPDNAVAGIKTNHWQIIEYLKLWTRRTTGHVIGKYLPSCSSLHLLGMSQARWFHQV